MANQNNPNGGKVSNTLASANFNTSIHKYVIPASDTNDYFVNDFVKTDSSSINGIPICERAAAGEVLVGVIIDFKQTFPSPETTHRRGGIEQEVLVCDDPIVELTIQANGVLYDSDIGKYADIAVGAGNTFIGQSTTQLDVNTLSVNSAQLKILSIVEDPTNSMGEFVKVRCMIHEHLLNGVGSGADHAKLFNLAYDDSGHGSGYTGFQRGTTLSGSDPTVNDDASLGYVGGNTWLNTTSKRAFICVDPSIGAAQWDPIEHSPSDIWERDAAQKRIYPANVGDVMKDQARDDRNEPTGMVSRTDNTISFTDGTRTFTISPSAGGFSFYQDALIYTSGTAQIVITDVEGIHAIYFDAGSLAEIVNPTASQYEDLILTKVWLASIYWDATNNLGKLFDKRHGIVMDGQENLHLYLTQGATHVSGLDLGSFVPDGDGSSDTHAQFAITSGVIRNSDIQITTNAIGSTTGLEIWFLDGTDWRWTTNTGFSVLTTGSGRLAYNDNNTGTQIEVGNNKFVLCHVFAGDTSDSNPIAVQGQAEYDSLVEAAFYAPTEIRILQLSNFPGKGLKMIGSAIFQTSDSYTNSVKGRVRSDLTGNAYIDFTNGPLNGTILGVSHWSAEGLAYDDSGHGNGYFGFQRGTTVASSAPTVNDDDTQGYVVGDLLVDEVADKSYRCLDPATGAAIWKEIVEGLEQYIEPLIVTPGKTSFTLSYAPATPSDTDAFINGQRRRYGISYDFTISGTTLTWHGYTLVGTEEFIVKYNYAPVPSGSETKELWFGTDYNANLGNIRVRSVAATGAYRFSFHIPNDFVTLVSCTAIGVISSGAAGAGKDIDLTSDYGAFGEAYNFHTESDTTTVYDFTGKANQWDEAIDLSVVLSNLSAGDSVGIQIDHNGIGGAISYIGIKFIYST